MNLYLRKGNNDILHLHMREWLLNRVRLLRCFRMLDENGGIGEKTKADKQALRSELIVTKRGMRCTFSLQAIKLY